MDHSLTSSFSNQSMVVVLLPNCIFFSFFGFSLHSKEFFFFFLWLTVVLIVPSAAGSPRNNELDKSKCRGKGPEETHVSF